MKIKTGFLTASALCLGFAVTSGFAALGAKPLGIKLTTASLPVTLVCTYDRDKVLRVKATKRNSGFVSFPTEETKLICNLHVFKGGQYILVTDFSFRVHPKDNKVKVHNAGLPQSDNSEYRYMLTNINWGDGVWVHFMGHGVKQPVKPLFNK